MNGSLNIILLVIIQHTIDARNQWRYVNLNVQLFHKQSVLAWFQLISSVLMQIILHYRQSVHEHLHNYSRINYKKFCKSSKCPLCFIFSMTSKSTELLSNYKTYWEKVKKKWKFLVVLTRHLMARKLGGSKYYVWRVGEEKYPFSCSMFCLRRITI